MAAAAMPQGAGPDKEKEYQQRGTDDKPANGDENEIEECAKCYACDTGPSTAWATLYNHLFKMNGLGADHYKGQCFHAKAEELSSRKVKTRMANPEVNAKATLKSEADVEQAGDPPTHTP